MLSVMERLTRRSGWLGGCLVWQGTRTHDGYGMIRRGQTMVTVHRAAWEEAYGPLPEGLTLDHVAARGCVHRNCWNLQHLEAVTLGDNIRRGRSANREKTHCPKGHPYDEANTIKRKVGRGCRECNREHLRERYRRTGK